MKSGDKWTIYNEALKIGLEELMRRNCPKNVQDSAAGRAQNIAETGETTIK